MQKYILHKSFFDNSDVSKRLLFNKFGHTNIESTIISEPSLRKAMDAWKNHERLAENDIETEEGFYIVVSLTYLYLQINYTGPIHCKKISEINEKILTYLHTAHLSLNELNELNKECLKRLIMDGEPVYSLVECPYLLSLALYITDHLLTREPILKWLLVKLLYLQQQLLENHSSTLKSRILSLLSDSEALLLSFMNTHDHIKERCAEFYLEKSLIYLYYRQEKEAEEALEKSACIYGFNWSLTGVLGKLTKFQAEETSQLIVRIDSSTMDHTKPNEDYTAAPQTIVLNDDVLLDMPTHIQSEKGIPLTAFDHCLLLAHCGLLYKNNPNDSIRNEKISAILSKVLEYSSNWSVYSLGLYYKSQIEVYSNRKTERALLQIQALLDQIQCEDSNWIDRLSYFWWLSPPTKWNLERNLGKLYMKFGMTLTALEVFKRLEMWEDVITCLIVADKEREAEEQILKLLQKDPNQPKIVHLLGDIRKDPTLYTRAWELSGQTYSAAQRSLGKYYFYKGEYENCIDAFTLALKVNPLFDNAWFMRGCAALKLDKLDIALQSFINCLSHRTNSNEEEKAEVWSNIASIHVLNHKWEEAANALRFALKAGFDNSKIWENYVFVSIQLHDLGQMLLAMKRIFELEGKVDLKALEFSMNAIFNELENDSFLIEKLDELLNLMNKKYSNEWSYWCLCATFQRFSRNTTKEVEYYTKAYRCLLAENYDKELDIFKELANVTLLMVNAMLELKPLNISQCILILKNLLKRTQEQFDGEDEYLKLGAKLEALES